MKKYALSLIIFVMIFSLVSHVLPMQVQAAESNTLDSIEQYDKNYYFETIIEDCIDSNIITPLANTKYVTKTKTTQMKNSSGNVMWSLSIKATFSYDGTTSKCINCTPSATSYASAWSIERTTSSINGNSATAKAVAKYTLSSGTTQSITKAVTIKCSPTGVVS